MSEGYKFDQRIEINFRNDTQDLYFKFDIGSQNDAMIVRITTEENISMDIDIFVFDEAKNMLAKGTDFETVVFRITKSGKYMVQLSYRNSIIRDMQSCPQTHFYINTITEAKTRDIGKKQEEVMDTSISSYTKIEEIFSKCKIL